ncbi:hypothetical protein [Palleronia caenipelagi]|uniref:Uncharacterized protein n=1 Tax=Palleronia caenipelagi TaxID=2489174 RepID=A0A547Q7P4_9RHOB|nr:hypothetical protein [Palleronia caenipelagi]TRD22383.1 hypothetical protein FEV53_04810 [Palleronia caenipelagi]
MAKHVIDSGFGRQVAGRLRRYETLRRRAQKSWSKTMGNVWSRRQPEPVGRGVQAFVAIERGRRV